jgi:hypothetical protein
MRGAYFFLFLFLAWTAAARAQSAPAQLLEGYWFGESYQPVLRETTQELMHRRGDGTFDIEFRLYQHCELTMDHKEAGRWSATEHVYHTDTETVDGHKIDTSDPGYHDDYRIEKLDHDIFIYVHTKSGVRASSRRVTGGDFVFPACGA